jgi:hypothetical protein
MSNQVMIEVVPDGKKWAVTVDGSIVALASNDFDADHFANRLARITTNAVVNRRPELRGRG